MYVHPFKVPVGGTVVIPIPTRGTDGAAVTGNTLADGDFAVHINGSTTAATIAAGATTPSTDFASATGRNQLVIDTSQDSDFAADAVAHVWLTKTIDSVATQECVAVFVMESAAELGLRRMQAMFASHTVGGTGNSTTVVHLSGIDAGQGDDEIIGEILLLYDVSEAEFHFCRVTDYANTGDLATVKNLYDGGALPFTPASGDYWFRVGHVGFPNAANLDSALGNYSATRGLAGTALPNAAADAAGGLPISDAGGLDIDAKLAATNEVTAARMGALTDWINGGRLDLLLDAVKAVTDALGATAAGRLALSSAGIISGTAATGTLNTTTATSSLTGYADDQLIGRILVVTSGDAAGEATDITDYAETNGTLTFTALTTAMANTDTFVIL